MTIDKKETSCNDVIGITPSDIAIIPEPVITPLTLLDKIIDKGGDIETMKEFMALQIQMDDRAARKSYNLAMAEFKKIPIEIDKDANVSYVSKRTGSKTEYDHATLQNVLSKVNPPLSENGLFMSFPPNQTNDGKINVVCRITHSEGHFEESTLSAPPDVSGNKDGAQAIGSTITRLSRYLALSMTGLATKDQDVETPQEQEPAITISDKQQIELSEMLESKDRTEEQFCGWAKIGKLADLYEEAFEFWMKKLRKIK